MTGSLAGTRRRSGATTGTCPKNAWPARRHVDEERGPAMTDGEQPDRALAETSAGAVQGGGQQDATAGPTPTDPDGPREKTSGAGAIVADPEPQPPDEMLPSTS